MRSQPVSFPNPSGELLVATLDLPGGGEPAGWAICAHGFTCGRKFKPVVHLARALTARGVAVLRFDFTGVGESAGDLAATTLTLNRGDVVAAAEWLTRNHAAPRLLVGHSLGGAAVLLAAADLPAVAAVAVIGTPDEPAHLSPPLAALRDEALSRGMAPLSAGGRDYRVGAAFFADLATVRLREAVAALGRPLLVMHALADDLVPLARGEALFAAARHPKSFVCLDGADHLLLDDRHARRAGGIIAAWASPWLGG